MRKRLTALLLCAVITVISSATVFGASFSDVPGNASYYTAVEKLSEEGVITGYYDSDEFKPANSITRSEFCALLARANGYEESSYRVVSLPFTDIKKGNWDEKFISFCFTQKYINGYEDNSFQPSNNITCEQAVKMVVCASGLDDGTLANTYGDRWYINYVARAKNKGILTDDMGFEAGMPASRAFVAQLVYNSMLISGDEKTDTSTSYGTSSSDYVLADADIWMPESAEMVAETENYYRYEQYYGENYEEILKEEENEKNYSVPSNNNEDDYEYIPVGSSDGMLVVIDPGHNYSGVDTGAVGNGLREQDITYLISEKLKPLLERNGFSVIMTRNSIKDNVSNESVSASLNRRAEIANRNGADLFLSIHCNAGGGTGTETYYCTGSGSGQKFAQCVQNRVVEEIGLRDRGVKSAKYAVLRNTDMTALLLETAFIDTASDAKVLGDSDYQQRFAEAIAKGICDYVGIDYN